MSLPTAGWSNKGGTGERSCVCGSWKNHWVNQAKKQWPASCSVADCDNLPTLGGHVVNPKVDGERIAPLCDSCNKRSGTFTLKGGVTLPYANKALTCEKP